MRVRGARRVVSFMLAVGKGLKTGGLEGTLLECWGELGMRAAGEESRSQSEEEIIVTLYRHLADILSQAWIHLSHLRRRGNLDERISLPMPCSDMLPTPRSLQKDAGVGKVQVMASSQPNAPQTRLT